jgi:hypothetical protein
MLTDTALKHLKPRDKAYKITDRDGMYAVVKPSGTIVFRYDYRLNGRCESLTIRPLRRGRHQPRPRAREMSGSAPDGGRRPIAVAGEAA